MNEESKNFWRKPWKGWRGVFGWFVLLAAATFVVVLTIGLTTSVNGGVMDVALPSLVVGIGIALLLVLAALFVRWLCNWRNFRRFLFGVACVITLIALLYAEEDWRGRRAWEKHRLVWEAKGEKFTIAALVPPLVPDEKNFAMTPLLKPVLEFTHGSNGIVWLDTNGMARLEKLRADLQMNKSTNSLALGSLEKGTLADLEACRDFYRGNTNYPQPVKSGTAAEDLLVALGKFNPEIEGLREAAATRPYSRFPIAYDQEPAWDILLPHLAHIKGLCQLMHARAIARLELGHSSAAWEELKLGLRLSDSIHDEPLLIDHLVRIATLSINLQTVREGLVRHAWSDAQLAELETYLASVNVLAEFKLGIRGERAFSTAGLDWLRRQGFRMDVMNYIGNEDGGAAFDTDIGFNPFPSGWFYQNMLTISRMLQDFTLAAVDEQTHRVFLDINKNGASALEKMRSGPYTFFARMLLPAMEHAVRKSARIQTYVDAARVAIALERYHLTDGKFPDTLDALVPRFIEKIPNDVIDGQPLKYRRTDDGQFILYSVGWNETDDGGKVVLSKTGNTIDNKQGDWVWRYPKK